MSARGLAPTGGLAGDGSAALPGLLRRLVWLGLAVLAAAFVAAAITRRLNFDEALALRAGWLTVQRLAGAPPFYMPTTWLLGALGSGVADPGAVMLIARLAVVATVGPALAWALAAGGRAATGALAGALVLSQATFVVHGLEFRYDWAILLGWLLAYRLVLRRRPWDFVGLGMVAAWLAAHHLKGLYFSVCLIALAAAAAGAEERGRRHLVRLAGGLAGGLLLWIAWSVLLGFGDALGSVYATFLGLAAGAESRVAPWESLAGTFRRDAVWWLGALLAVIATLWRLPRSRR